jgi:4'-phosphopantetheinyl transferase
VTGDVVDIWLIRTDLPDLVLAGLERLLDEHELRRAGALHHADDRRRFTAAHGAARVIIGRCIGVPAGGLRWRHGPHGKPELDGEPAAPQLSVSHSGEFSALALSLGRPVGVDVQHLVAGLDVTGLSARFYPRAEARFVAAAARPGAQASRFLRLWTRKEACVKVTGGRLLQGLKLPVRGTGPVVVTAPGEALPGPYLVRDIPVPDGCHASVALEGTLPYRVRRHWWPVDHSAGG